MGVEFVSFSWVQKLVRLGRVIMSLSQLTQILGEEFTPGLYT